MKHWQIWKDLMCHWDCGVFSFFLSVSAKTKRKPTKLLNRTGFKEEVKIVILINARNYSYSLSFWLKWSRQNRATELPRPPAVVFLLLPYSFFIGVFLEPHLGMGAGHVSIPYPLVQSSCFISLRFHLFGLIRSVWWAKCDPYLYIINYPKLLCKIFVLLTC